MMATCGANSLSFSWSRGPLIVGMRTSSTMHAGVSPEYCARKSSALWQIRGEIPMLPSSQSTDSQSSGSSSTTYTAEVTSDAVTSTPRRPSSSSSRRHSPDGATPTSG